MTTTRIRNLAWTLLLLLTGTGLLTAWMGITLGRGADTHLQGHYHEMSQQQRAHQLRHMTAALHREVLLAEQTLDETALYHAASHARDFFRTTAKMRVYLHEDLADKPLEAFHLAELQLLALDDIEQDFRKVMGLFLVQAGEYIDTRQSQPESVARFHAAAEAFEHKMDALLNHIDQSMAQRLQQMQAQTRKATQALTLMATLFVGLLLWALWFVHVRLTSPIAQLEHFITRASRDPARIPDRLKFRFRDEMQHLAGALNQLLDRFQDNTQRLLERERESSERRQALEIKARLMAALLEEVKTPFQQRALRALAILSGLSGLHPDGGLWFYAPKLLALNITEGWIGYGKRIWARPSPQLSLGAIDILSHCNHMPGVEHGHYFVSMGHLGEEIGILVLDSLPNPPADLFRRALLSDIAEAFSFAILDEHARATQSAAQAVQVKAHLVSILPTPLLQLDIHGRILLANAAAQKLIGADPTGQMWRDFAEEEEEEEEEEEGVSLCRLLTHGLHQQWLVSLAGRHLPVAIATVALTDQEQHTNGMVISITDLSEIRAAEAERMRLVAQTTNQSKLATLGEMATGIMHEINQPLTYISATVYTLQRHRRKGLPLQENDIDTMLDESARQIERITKIMRHLRVFGRSDSLEEDRSPVDWGTVLDNALLLMGQKLTNHGIDLVRKVDAPLPQVMGNANAFEQVLINLLQNALHALEGREGGRIEIAMKVQAASDKGQGNSLESCSLSLAPVLVIRFTDNGCGMPPEVRQKCFEPFYTTKPVGEGTGIGLSLVHGIVTQYGGTIAVESEPDTGTSFTLRFPLAQT